MVLVVHRIWVRRIEFSLLWNSQTKWRRLTTEWFMHFIKISSTFFAFLFQLNEGNEHLALIMKTPRKIKGCKRNGIEIDTANFFICKRMAGGDITKWICRYVDNKNGCLQVFPFQFVPHSMLFILLIQTESGIAVGIIVARITKWKQMLSFLAPFLCKHNWKSYFTLAYKSLRRNKRRVKNNSS